MVKLTAVLFILMMPLSISTASDLPSQTSRPQELNHWIIPPSSAPPSKLLLSLGLSQRSLRSVAQACCKVCRKGKACGDTCISRDKECHVPPGCACDG
jgi:hypothetical protein